MGQRRVETMRDWCKTGQINPPELPPGVGSYLLLVGLGVALVILGILVLAAGLWRDWRITYSRHVR